ncbi:uncharacterized protein MYCFIDRAFT_134223 [Pseudocercospora fijiensis CIRAD86]|uniref:Amidase domain-containing protein n=1 Tax=Pseudocercospora fijiensis (strain CIRAD86) TaxID=383855 RepID=M2Z2M0_PSEFD|nr:uncharacterized protein MYCFIDRAFT_134223 [Pseudocercospora fijiensis CIRAD86]EME84100.1 hypothetical protein MYCFIDRAFT_134223 [Pseudocercospora fijiensis CIRAD86]
MNTSAPAKLHTLTATQALHLLKDNTITAEQYARALLDHIEERDDIVQAWTYIDRKLVLSQARELDKLHQNERGPLHGIPVGIKDIMNTKDMPTEYGSPLYQGNRPGSDASPVAVLRRAGAVIMGKTTTTEFTVLNSGPNATNPHDVRRTPGGSSAGSAAAVADFQVPLSFGTQNGGSIIRPASYTGIFAMKLSLNAMSPEGVKVVSFSIDRCGTFARSLEDLQLLADVFRFPSKEARVAFVKTPVWSLAGPGTIAAMDNAAAILKKHGVHVEEVDLPSELNDADVLRATQRVVLRYEAHSAFLADTLRDVNETKMDRRIRNMIDNGGNLTIAEVAGAVDRYARLRSEFDKFAVKYSAVLAPSAQVIAPLGIGDMGDSSFNFMWSGLHTPVVHIPAFTGENGLPVGLSVIAGRYQDQYLLKICKVLANPLMAEGGWNVIETAAGTKL